MSVSATHSVDTELAKALTLPSHPSTTSVLPLPEAKANASVSATVEAVAVPQASQAHVQKAMKGVDAAGAVAIVFGLLMLVLLVLLGILGKRFRAIWREQQGLRNRVRILELTGGQGADEGVVAGVPSVREVRSGDVGNDLRNDGVMKEDTAVQNTQVGHRVMDKPRKGRWRFLKRKESWE